MKKAMMVMAAMSAALVGSGIAFAQMPIVIYSEIAGDPTAQVPGFPAGTYFESFERPYASPNGQYWLMECDHDGDSAQDNFILKGSGTDGSTAFTVLQEGKEAPWNTAELMGTIGDRNMGINDNGDFAVAANTNGPTVSDEYIVKSIGGAWSIVAQEGQPLPAPHETGMWSTTLNSPFILADGTVGYRGDSNLDTSFDYFLMLADTVIAQEGVTIPGNQGGGATSPWDNLDSQDYYMNATGTVWIAQGDTEAATSEDDIAVVNGNVVVQEGYTIGDFTIPVDGSGISQIYMTSNGDWMVRGDNDDNKDWIYRNGTVIAQTGDEVPGSGGTEFYDDTRFASCFFHMIGNGEGDYIIGAVTDAADEEFDAVLVLNGQQVVARQGDPVDLNGDGIDNDNTYIDIFNDDDGFLTNDLMLYFTAILRDGSGADLGQAFMYIDLGGSEPCPFDLDDNGAVGPGDVGVVKNNFGCDINLPGCAALDFDNNGAVGPGDVGAVKNEFGPCP